MITSGPYAHIRHPIFTGLVLQMIGLALVFLYPITIGLLLIAITYGVYTILHEEKFMAAKFPEYKDYMSRTSRFIPKFVKK